MANSDTVNFLSDSISGIGSMAKKGGQYFSNVLQNTTGVDLSKVPEQLKDKVIRPLSNLTQSPSVLISGTPTQERNPEITSKEDVNDIIGLPPQAYLASSDNYNAVVKKVLQSMLIVDVYPAYPKFAGIISQSGLNLYKVDVVKGKEAYEKALTGTGVKNITTPVRIAVINDASISETFQSDFGDSDLESSINSMGDTMRGLKFMSGNNPGEAIAETMKGVTQLFGDTKNGAIGGLGNMMGSAANSLGSGLKNAAENLAPGVGSGVASILTGGTVDFPKVWKGSSFAPSYSHTIRLFNPFPSDYKSYLKFIVEPLARLLALVVPLSDSNFTISYPVIVKVKCPGLYTLDAGYVQSIEVIKGGQSNDFSFYQRCGQIDVRITFSSLYDIMMARTQENVNEDRPTLDRYIRNLKGYVKPPTITEADGVSKSANGDVTIRDNDNVFKMGFSTGIKSDAVINVFANVNTRNRNTLVRNEIKNSISLIDPIAAYSNGYSTLDIAINKKMESAMNTFRVNHRTDRILKLEDKIAYKIKYSYEGTDRRYDVGLEPSMETWFWNNYNTFDNNTQSIVTGIPQPGIGVNMTASLTVGVNTNVGESGVL